MDQVIVTLKSPKGSIYQLETSKDKMDTVKRNAAQWGQTIVKVETK
jgi:hypothetical protein